MLNTELIDQFAHIWRVFWRLVNDFDDQSWLHAGRKVMRPARLSLHVLKSTKFYLQDDTTFIFPSGKPLDLNGMTADDSELPSREDLKWGIKEFAQNTEAWLSRMDLASPNEAFDWAGKTKLGLVVFLLKHSLFHIGELSCLLNESRNGEAEDNYVKALQEKD
jgi:hypothetical protein